MARVLAWLAARMSGALPFSLMIAAACTLSYMSGHSDGGRLCAENQLAAVREQFAAYAAQLEKAQQASLAHLRELEKQESHHAQSTRALQRALSASREQRADCRLPADLMQHLEAARAAAVRAAAAGVDTALPAARSD